MKAELEKDIQRAILDLLRIKKYVVFKHHSTGFTVRDGSAVAFRQGDRGIADIIGCSPTGRFVAIEVKRKGGRASDDQLAFLDAVRQNGGIAILAHSIDDVLAHLEGAGPNPVH